MLALKADILEYLGADFVSRWRHVVQIWLHCKIRFLLDLAENLYYL